MIKVIIELLSNKEVRYIVYSYATDIFENDIAKIGMDILEILLFDRTTKRNIIWATSDYEMYGEEYNSRFPITVNLISDINSNIIRPRVTKNKGNKLARTKEKAEVFTPSWICNIQNNLVDSEWFGRKDVFNIETDKSWITTNEVISFPKDNKHSWKKYVDDKRLEITCGEAPYLVSRYDTVTGTPISVKDRIGLLDRKLRIVNENTDTIENWYKWTKRAFESIYGFEFQGDSLLLARENILYTFIDNYVFKFNSVPDNKKIKEIAIVISWNVWQMDGLKFTVPYEKVYEQFFQIPIESPTSNQNQPCYCKIKDWRSKKTLTYKSIVLEGC